MSETRGTCRCTFCGDSTAHWVLLAGLRMVLIPMETLTNNPTYPVLCDSCKEEKTRALRLRGMVGRWVDLSAAPYEGEQ